MGKRIAIYPGSFDPVTNGHLDILSRALQIFDHVIVAVTQVENKQPLFSIEERLEMLQQSTRGMKHVSVESFRGLLVEYAHRKGACVLIRGLRAVSDFEYEFQMALMNRHLSRKFKGGFNLETVYLMPDEKYTYLTSTVVRTVARMGGNINSFVPACTAKALKKKFSNERSRSRNAEVRL